MSKTARKNAHSMDRAEKREMAQIGAGIKARKAELDLREQLHELFREEIPLPTKRTSTTPRTFWTEPEPVETFVSTRYHDDSHTITVERVNGAISVVERYEGSLVKVCARYKTVTATFVESVARSYARTYGAVYGGMMIQPVVPTKVRMRDMDHLLRTNRGVQVDEQPMPHQVAAHALSTYAR